jgi:hypothetical protein
MSNRYLKFEDTNSIVRDANSNGVINIDNTAYSLHKKNKELAKRKREAELDVENRINNIEQKMTALETSMNKILDILTNGRS